MLVPDDLEAGGLEQEVRPGASGLLLQCVRDVVAEAPPGEDLVVLVVEHLVHGAHGGAPPLIVIQEVLRELVLALVPVPLAVVVGLLRDVGRISVEPSLVLRVLRDEAPGGLGADALLAFDPQDQLRIQGDHQPGVAEDEPDAVGCGHRDARQGEGDGAPVVRGLHGDVRRGVVPEPLEEPEREPSSDAELRLAVEDVQPVAADDPDEVLEVGSADGLGRAPVADPRIEVHEPQLERELEGSGGYGVGEVLVDVEAIAVLVSQVQMEAGVGELVGFDAGRDALRGPDPAEPRRIGAGGPGPSIEVVLRVDRADHGWDAVQWRLLDLFRHG